MGKPIGSGAGDATNPSNCLMREIVAVLTPGPVQAGAAMATVVNGRRRMEEVLAEYCILGFWILILQSWNGSEGNDIEVALKPGISLAL